MAERVLVRFRLASGHLFEKSCSFSRTYVLFVLCLFVILVVFRFGFDGKTVLLIHQFLVIAYLLLYYHCTLRTSVYGFLMFHIQLNI